MDRPRCFLCGVAFREGGPCMIPYNPAAYMAGMTTCVREDTLPTDDQLGDE